MLKMLLKNKAKFRVFHLLQKHELIKPNHQHSSAKKRKFANWSHANTNEEGVTAFLKDNAVPLTETSQYLDIFLHGSYAFLLLLNDWLTLIVQMS